MAQLPCILKPQPRHPWLGARWGEAVLRLFPARPAQGWDDKLRVSCGARVINPLPHKSHLHSAYTLRNPTHTQK